MVCERKRGYGVREGVWYERGSVRERGSMVCEREREYGVCERECVREGVWCVRESME